MSKKNNPISFYRKRSLIYYLIHFSILCIVPSIISIITGKHWIFFVFLGLCVSSVLMLIHQKNVIALIEKIFPDPGSRLRHYLLIIKDRKKSEFLEYEEEKLTEQLVPVKMSYFNNDFLRLFYVHILLLMVFMLFYRPAMINEGNFHIKENDILYNEFTAAPISIYVRTYSISLDLSAYNNEKKMGIFKLKDEKITLTGLEEGVLRIVSNDHSKVIRVNTIKKVGIDGVFVQKIKDKTTPVIDSVIEGSDLVYEIKLNGDHDSFLISISDGTLKKPMLSGKLKPSGDIYFDLSVFKNGQLCGNYEKTIKLIKNDAPSITVLKPEKDLELESFYGDIELQFSVFDKDGIESVSLLSESEGFKKEHGFKIAKNRTNIDIARSFRLEDMTRIGNRVLYFHVEATDIYGKTGRSQVFTVSLFKKEDIEEMFMRLGRQVFADMVSAGEGFESQKDSMSKDFQEIQKKVEETAEKIEKTIDYFKAEVEQLKLSTEIAEQFKTQMDLLREMLDKNVLDLLAEKMKNLSPSQKDISLTKDDLEKLSFELERIIESLKEYKKGMDAVKIAEKIEKVELDSERPAKMDDIKADADDLFSRFDQRDREMMDPDEAMLSISEMKQEKDPAKFSEKKQQLSEGFKKYGEQKMKGGEMDIAPLVNTAVEIDLSKGFDYQNIDFISRKLDDLDTELQKLAVMAFMLDYSLIRSFKNAKSNFFSFIQEEEKHYKSRFDNNYSVFMNELLDLVENMQASSSCPEPGSNLFQMLNQLSSDQSALNEFLEKLMQDFQQSGMSERLQKALEQAMEKQGELQKRLRELADDIEKEKGEGKIAGGDVESIIKEMKELEEMIEKVKLDENMKRTGEKIVIKLLDLQRSIYQRQDEPVRYSKIGHFLQKWYPDILEKKTSEEIMRYSEYEDLIKKILE